MVDAPASPPIDFAALADSFPGAAQGASPAPATPTPATPVAQGPDASPTATPDAPGATAPATPPAPGSDDDMDAGDDDAKQFATGLVSGAAQGLFNTKDAITSGFGQWGKSTPAEEDRSFLRQAVDGVADENAKSTVGGFSQTLAQVGVGLLGAGKFAALPGLIGKGLLAAKQVAAFAPHAQNFANLAEQIPGVGNTWVSYLASSPDDSDTLGYLKNGLSSLGFDAAVVGTFAATAKVVKAFTSGADQAALKAAGDELEADIRGHVEASQAGNAPAAEVEAPAAPAPEGGPAKVTGSLEEDTPEAAAGDQAQAPPDVHVVSSPSVTATPGELPGRPKLAPITDDQMAGIATSAGNDYDAIVKYGSWDNAIANGHVFGDDGARIPWQMMADTNTGQAETTLDAFKVRLVSHLMDQGALQGGEAAVQTDAQTLSTVGHYADMWNQDPSAVLGALNAAGKEAPMMRANMQASFMLAQRAMQDAWAMASRIRLGYLDEWNGSAEQAHVALKQVTGAAASFFQDGNSLLANAGRTVRGAQAQFRMSPDQIAALQSLDGDHLVEMLKSTNGMPAALKIATQPGIIRQAIDAAMFLRVNDLISSPTTHVIIAGSNLFQTIARPAMRMVGAKTAGMFADEAGAQALSTVGQEAKRQYAYMASSIPESWAAAVKAWSMGDSIIAPHALEATTGATPLGQMIAQKEFVPVGSISDVLSNFFTFAQKTVALPGRLVGSSDELVKQVGYRSMVAAKAEVAGSAAGLEGDALIQHVRSAINNAFDSMGRATDAEALQEAKVATFQNELGGKGEGNFGLPTAGFKLQGFTNDYPPAKLIFPFVKTPVNLFRQSVQLTPMLNMAQKEFRDGFNGVMGPAAQAQAHGQMALGALMMGTIATLAYQGLITGDAPMDPVQRKALEDTGWRANSIAIPHKDDQGRVIGKTYIPFDRFDPVAMNFGMAANIVSVLKNPDPAVASKAQNMLVAMATGLLKQVMDKTYLQSVKQTVDLLQDPDKNGARFMGGQASGFIPFSSGLKLVNPDPYQRDAQSFIDNTMKNIPGWSPSISPMRDWKGDPVSAHRGLWLDTDEGKTDDEIQRLAIEQQSAPLDRPTSKATGGTDLRNITMAGDRDKGQAGKSAYDRFQELAGHPERFYGGNPNIPSLGTVINKIIASDAYQKLPDGTNGEQNTKSGMIAGKVHEYRSMALQMMAGDKNVRDAEQAENQRIKNQAAILRSPNPTQANQTGSFMANIAKQFGFSAAPPSSATPPQ